MIKDNAQIDVLNLPEIPEVYDSLRTTKDNIGIFQMGAQKTAHICHLYKHIDSLDDLSDIAAIIRPGMSDTKMEDGKSATEHYIAKKNGDEEVEYAHPSLEKVLKNTVAEYVYQEGAIQVASDVAGFSLVEADLLRQAIGKKKVDVMAKIKPKFIEGCIQHSNMPREIAEREFEKISSAGRYSFNKCISGRETIFRPSYKNGGFKPTIGEMYRIHNDRQYAKQTGHESLYKKYKSGDWGNCYSLSDKDKRLHKNKIVDIRYMGVRPIYHIALDNGYTIDVTDNHKFPVKSSIAHDEWIEKQTKALNVGDILYVCSFDPYVQETYHKQDKGMRIAHARITSIKYIGEEDVYDVEVSNKVSHTFLTQNGIITCNSHSTSYGYVAYINLYFRYYYPHLFYATSLAYEVLTGGKKDEKIKKIKRMIQAARARDIQVYGPSLRRRNIHTDFSVEENSIYIGFNAINGITPKTIQNIFTKIEKIEKNNGHILDNNWISILVNFYKAIGKKAIESFISVGLFDSISLNRAGLLYDCTDWENLTNKEIEWIIHNKSSFDQSHTLSDILSLLAKAPFGRGGGCSNLGRSQAVRSLSGLSVKNRPKKTTDQWIIAKEETLMGVC